MGLVEVRSAIIPKLKEGRIQHETRLGRIDDKNLLVAGVINVDSVIELLSATRGNQFSTSKHHLDEDIDVYIFKPERKGIRWYIKCYEVGPDVWFISVHK